MVIVIIIWVLGVNNYVTNKYAICFINILAQNI